jgi:hypothetical protein
VAPSEERALKVALAVTPVETQAHSPVAAVGVAAVPALLAVAAKVRLGVFALRFFKDVGNEKRNSCGRLVMITDEPPIKH